MSETERHEINWKGHKILAVYGQEHTAAILASVRLSPPLVPFGSNVGLLLFTTKGGARALAANQSGALPVASDDERPVNGCSVFVLGESLGSNELDDQVLNGFLKELLGDAGLSGVDGIFPIPG